MTRHPLPSTGSAWQAFSRFAGTMECSDSLPPVPSRFVSFARRLPPLASVFVSPAKSDADLGPGVFGAGNSSKPVGKEMETSGRPKFLGNPIVPAPCSWTPARPACQAIRQVGAAPRAFNYGGSPRAVISGLDHTASALAVYASQCGSRRPTQDSLLAAGQLYQAGLHTRRVPTKGFRNASYIPSPFPKLSWRNESPLEEVGPLPERTSMGNGS